MMKLFLVAVITSVLDFVGAAAASIARACKFVCNQSNSFGLERDPHAALRMLSTR